jgi:Ni,Fe-hydrogenase III large subunit
MNSKETYYIEISSNPGMADLKDIPVLPYEDFSNKTISLLSREANHCLNYFVYKSDSLLDFYILIANDDSHKILVYSHRQPAEIKVLDSITKNCFQLHSFEREISENTGISFTGHPWMKPLRYSYNRADRNSVMKDYPFYKIESEETHEVGVGPVHAGVIEPGHFRFLCYGEKVLHLEIQLGYQHRGVEELFLNKTRLLQRSILSENIAGDTVAGHSNAFAMVAEALGSIDVDSGLQTERTIALEMERMAVHIGDTGALCGDVAYQIGQVTCEALRSIVINTMQDWCGNRFSKGLVRPGGTRFPLKPEMIRIISERLTEVNHRFLEVADLIFQNSGVIARFENTGTVSRKQAQLAGAVGMAARASGIRRDIRKSHPFMAYHESGYSPVTLESGDVLARALLRKLEFEASYSIIRQLIAKLERRQGNPYPLPASDIKFKPGVLCMSLVEGWRGEISHAAITDKNGNLVKYKIKDPSFHNWHVLALAVREQEISDFPVCNKSFNLSYCGNDL